MAPSKSSKSRKGLKQAKKLQHTRPLKVNVGDITVMKKTDNSTPTLQS